MEDVASIGNLMRAARKARKGKSRRPDVEEFTLRLESNLLALQELLMAGEWKPGPYHLFTIRDPKHRVIAAAPFADRVVHHALCAFMQPELEKSFHPSSFSCRVGMGTTAAREHVRKLVNRYPYCLKCDVRKFFDSINHAILLGKIRPHIPCPKVMEMVARLVNGYEKTQGVGLPIGNLTSQLWGNFLLTRMDHEISGLPVSTGYARYTDDFLVFSNNKAALWQVKGRVEKEINECGLMLASEKCRVLPCREGVPFCGFRFFPGMRPRILGEPKRRFEKRRERLLKSEARMAELSRMVYAWYQYSREGNSIGLKCSYARRKVRFS